MQEPSPIQVREFIHRRFQAPKYEKDWAVVLCPFHDDHTQSLRINLTHGGFICNPCNTKGSIITLAKRVLNCEFPEAMQEIFGADWQPASAGKRGGKPKPAGPTITRHFIYTDVDGTPLYRVVRIEGSDGKKTRAPWQEHPEGAGWAKGRGPAEPVLYRLPDLVHTSEIWIPEGEHLVEILRGWGLTATCNLGGAGKWPADCNHFFADRAAIILADNDAAGAKHAAFIAPQIHAAGAKSIKIITLPDLPPKGDLFEWVKAGGDKAALLKIRDAAPAWQTPAVTAEKAKSNGHGTTPPSEWDEFWLKDDGLHTFIYDKNEVPRDVWICAPLEVAAITHDEHGENWGRLLKWRDRDHREHCWAMPMHLLAGNGEEFRKSVLNGGLEISTQKAARDKLMKYVAQATPEQRGVSVTKVGWHGDVFVMPDETIGAPTKPGEPKQLYFYQPQQESWHNIRVHGTAEDWRDYIGKYCAGNSRLILAVSCAFAAPLLSLTDSESGGFHFYGDSSKGKSTAQTVAGSVWGGGAEKGYLESWRTTANGLEIFAEVHNDGLGCLDEIGQIDARQLGEAVYMLANGQGKGRMSKNVGSRKRLTWAMLFLSSGNVTLAQHMGEAGQAVHTALEIRLVSITADAGERMGMFEDIHGWPDSKAFAEYLVSSAYKCYGAPIREFLKMLARDRLKIAGRIRERMELFAIDAMPPTAPSEIRRAGRRFGLCVAAGELATEWGLTGWTKNEIAPLIKKNLQDWLQTREPSDTDRGVRAVRQFIEQHGASRFQDHKASETDRVINRAGFKKSWDGESTEFWFLPEVFRAEVCRGFNPTAVLEALRDKGFLLKGEQERPSTVVRVPGLGSTRVYRIDSAILE